MTNFDPKFLADEPPADRPKDQPARDEDYFPGVFIIEPDPKEPDGFKTSISVGGKITRLRFGVPIDEDIIYLSNRRKPPKRKN